MKLVKDVGVEVEGPAVVGDRVEAADEAEVDGLEAAGAAEVDGVGAAGAAEVDGLEAEGVVRGAEVPGAKSSPAAVSS